MVKNLGVILTGLLAFQMYGQEAPISKENPERKTQEVELVKKEARYYQQSSEGYMGATVSRIEIINSYHELAEPIIKRIQSGTETNYPSAWLNVANFKRDAGRLEKDVGFNMVKIRELYDKEYDSWKSIGTNLESLKERKKELDYNKYFQASRNSYETAKKYYEEAGDVINAIRITETLAGEDEERGDMYKSIRKSRK